MESNNSCTTPSILKGLQLVAVGNAHGTVQRFPTLKGVEPRLLVCFKHLWSPFIVQPLQQLTMRAVDGYQISSRQDIKSNALNDCSERRFTAKNNISVSKSKNAKNPKGINLVSHR
jgi:hypothetical protein